MKRTMWIWAGVATLGAGIYLSSHVWAQQGQYQQTYSGQAATSAPQTKVALVNLGVVIKNYQRFKNFQADFKVKQEGYQKQMEQLQGQLTKCQQDASQAGATQDQRDQLADQAKNIQRQMQDTREKANQELGKQMDAEMILIYKEVKEAVDRYARSNNIELVLHYNDGVNGDEYLPVFLRQKLQNNACVPMFITPGMDISQNIIANMNSRLQSAAQPPYNSGSHQ